MKDKKVILFDLDDTLYDYEPIHKIALKAVHKRLSKEIDISYKKFYKLYKESKLEIYRELAGSASSHNRVVQFQRIIEKTHRTVESALILEMYDVYWNIFLRNMKINRDVINTFKKLRRAGLKIALVTNMTTHIQLRKMEKLKITSYIDTLVTSEETGADKPRAVMFLLALNKLDFKASDALMVGDSTVSDVEGANAVGIDSVLITKNKKNVSKVGYKKPNYVISKISDLLNILKI